jgi:hypothetical protein
MELALDGDHHAMRLCMERILPARRERTIRLELPEGDQPADISAALSAITAAITAGQITPIEGEVLGSIYALKMKAWQEQECDRRLARLEQLAAEHHSPTGGGEAAPAI